MAGCDNQHSKPKQATIIAFDIAVYLSYMERTVFFLSFFLSFFHAFFLPFFLSFFLPIFLSFFFPSFSLSFFLSRFLSRFLSFFLFGFLSFFIFRQSIVYQGAVAWNGLDNDHKCCNSITSFKHLYKASTCM